MDRCSPGTAGRSANVSPDKLFKNAFCHGKLFRRQLPCPRSYWRSLGNDVMINLVSKSLARTLRQSNKFRKVCQDFDVLSRTNKSKNGSISDKAFNATTCCGVQKSCLVKNRNKVKMSQQVRSNNWIRNCSYTKIPRYIATQVKIQRDIFLAKNTNSRVVYSKQYKVVGFFSLSFFVGRK